MGDGDAMKNRIFDCIDGRFSSARLSEREQRLLAKIESGLRNRTDDYRFAEGPYRPTPPARISPPPRRGSHEGSPLDAFLERSARSWLRAG